MNVNSGRRVIYPIIIFGALRVKIRDADSRMVNNNVAYMALGVDRDGLREVRGLWVADKTGAKLRVSVLNELKNPRVQDVLIAAVEDMKGFSESIMPAFPRAADQICCVHLLRHSQNFCASKDRNALAAGDPVLRLRSCDPQDHLNHEFHRKSEPRDPQIHQDARLIPDRGSGQKADLSGHP